jgi:hypothetical protein
MEYDRITVRERGTDRLLTIQQGEIPKSLPHFEIGGDKRIYQQLHGL